jgi:FMN-dependent oxidoreductase (nitrilotriacetate monooxygenase family)
LEADAVVRDADAGRYSDPEKVHPIDHSGEYFDVPGPHGCEPSPQRTPVLYQAGSSDRGREFAARNAEAVFVSQPTPEKVASYMADLRERAADHGRDPDDLSFFPGVVPIVAATEDLAEAKRESYEAHVDVEGVLALLSGFVDMDLSELDPDQKIQHIETEAIQGTVDAFAGGESEWTVREMAEFAGLGTTSPVVVGTPGQVADELEWWYDEVGVDGFNVKEVVRPDTLREFVDLVVPELRERGLVREAYEHDTLRGNLLGRDRLADDHPGRSVGVDD